MNYDDLKKQRDLYQVTTYVLTGGLIASLAGVFALAVALISQIH